MNQEILNYLKFAKDISPEIFENPTPKFHLEILEFILNDGNKKACAIFRGAGKSTLLNKIFVVCQLFFHYEPFTMLVSADKEKACNFLRDIKDMIISANRKGYAISKGEIWASDRCEIIINAGLKDKDGNSLERACFICAMGAGQDPRGYIYHHRRPSLIIADDLESKLGQYAIANIKNRQKIKEWFFADLAPTLHPTKGKLVIIGTIIHEDSLLNTILMDKEENSRGWQTKRIPIIENNRSTWPSRFPIGLIEAKKAELAQLGLENEFYQEYMCRAISPEKQLFKREYLRYFKRVNYDLSVAPVYYSDSDSIKTIEITAYPAKSLTLENNSELELNRCTIYTTMDLATYDGHDKTAIVTFAVNEYNIYIIDIECGHWTPFEKGLKALEVYLKFRPIRFGIERAGAQNDFFYTIDQVQKRSGITIPVEKLKHHSNAKNVRISQLHPDFASGRVIINASLQNAGELEAQLLSFDPQTDSKYDDIIDALAYIKEFTRGRYFAKDDESESDNIWDYDSSDTSWV